MSNFVHLHVHTQYSILDGAAEIGALIDKAVEDKQSALAITDHGNMFGAKTFFDTAQKKGIKPILGMEAYVAVKSRHDKKDKEDRSGDHLVILAKNLNGYHNLIKLASLAYTEGYYYKPRIDKELLEKYHEDLIISSACLGGEIPQKIMKNDIKGAEEAILWYKNLFGDDYYLELQRHDTGDPTRNAEIYEHQVKVNKVLVELAQKHEVKIIATNDVHFINAKDAEAHDLLICMNTGKDLDDPNRMRYSMQEYLKTQKEMAKIFSDLPDAISNTIEITEKIEAYDLNSKPIMPDFPLPEEFDNEDDYLRHITYEGAKERYGEDLSETKIERIDFELETIKNMGFPGYFLIVWDFIKAAREMGVLVGPGRGSAAGSVVAYCTKITNIDPIKYDLLFERFLNPDRISMPDIDIDFDDDGRQEVMNWVVKKYGYERVAQIITFGKMAAKSAIRDVARVYKMPLPESDKYAKLVPEGPKVKLKKALVEVPELIDAKKNGSELVKKTLSFAETLEGSVRQTGVHACGIIISKENLMNYLPISYNKDVKLLITQFEGNVVESVGMLKMDFLGLKTLSIIKECIANIKLSKGIEIDIDHIPPDDKKTFELYSSGDTTAIFQFESDGMKKHLRSLKPNQFLDLVAMNALYRPGPMQYIPSFIKRKHGKEEIKYDHPLMKDYLEETYGITVFQEQVMLQSRALGGFTRGMSDSLRKAMGKKKKKMMEELKVKFIEGCNNNPDFIEGCKEVKKAPNELILKIWADWEKFAEYAFNKSHSVCYADVSYRTAFLKANYPAEFMAAVLSRNLTDIKKITTFMDECRRMGLNVLGPSVNESYSKFTVNSQGAIRFGMAAIKGVGEAAVIEIIRERDENGQFKDIFDFVERINQSIVGKKTIESLAMAGAFDDFNEINRHQFFIQDNSGASFIETLTKYGGKFQTDKESNENSLFGGGGSGAGLEIQKPEIPQGEEWSHIEQLNKEKELVGIYLSAHPLDDFKLELEKICNHKLPELNNLATMNNGHEIRVGGMVSAIEHRTTKTGKPFGSFTLEDFSGQYKFMLFGKDYPAFKDILTQGANLMVFGKVQRRPYGDQELEFKISKIEYLAEVREKFMKSVALKVQIEKINSDFIQEMQQLIEQNKGKTDLKFLIYDPSSKIWVQMFSRSYRLKITNDLLDFFDNSEFIEEYKID